MNAQWRIELFGGLRVTSGERIITRFRTRKIGALLAYLAYHLDRSHPREVLFELLWPECLPSAGRNNLSNALSTLRHQLEPPGVPQGAVIVADRASVRLNPATVTTDVSEFEAALQATARADNDAERTQHLADAIELYRGELLSGFYENWILLEGQRLNELFFQALRHLIAHHEQTGDIHQAMSYAQRGVSVDPLREESHTELIRLYAAAGQTTAALRQYAELERILREEFDDAPSAATRELARLISNRSAVSREQLSVGSCQSAVSRRRKVERRGKEGAIALAPPPCHSLTSPLPTADRRLPTLPLQLTRFFGREKEIAWLRERLMSEGMRLVTLTGAGRRASPVKWQGAWSSRSMARCPLSRSPTSLTRD
jgi:DNA-binding SARP family transcriptional activator